MSLWNRLLTIPHPDPEVQRRGRNLLIIGLTLSAMSILAIPLVMIQPDPLPQLVANLTGLTLVLVLLVIARLGWVDQAALWLIIVLTVSFAVIPFGTGQIGLVPIFAVVVVTTAAVIGREWHVVVASIVGIAGMTGQWFGLAS